MSGCGKTEDLSHLTIQFLQQEIEAWLCAHGHVSLGPFSRA